MRKVIFRVLLFPVFLAAACHDRDSGRNNIEKEVSFREGEFGYDLAFLKKQDPALILLKDGASQLIVSPRYQAKVFTSTATGERGISFGWINYKAFGNRQDPHMNAYGGENRIWLGPEGGKYSLFFKPGSKMEFENWKTPEAFDTENWVLENLDSIHVTMQKDMNLLNYAGAILNMGVKRTIKILNRREIAERTGISGLDAVQAVGYETENILSNKGDRVWTVLTGLPCIWILDMLKPSPSTIIVIPFRKSDGDFKKVATTNYFGEITSDRIKHYDSFLLFKADGKSRGKIGIRPKSALPIAGSYDRQNSVLTIIMFDLDDKARYLNQQWTTEKPPFSGDAVNAYNDGPLADGSQMGPFYEIESVSPAGFLKAGESVTHRHTVFHYLGNETELNGICRKLLGTSLDHIGTSFFDTP
jgi:hypothetical protein